MGTNRRRKNRKSRRREKDELIKKKVIKPKHEGRSKLVLKLFCHFIFSNSFLYLVISAVIYRTF